MEKTIFTFEKLYRAYLDCRKTKRKTVNALKFEWNLERNLFQLQKEIEAKTYKPGRSICFAVKEPSIREIFAADFRDRVVHHLLIREIEAIGERKFIFDSFACRKNKGTHLAINRLRNFIRKITENYKKEAFYCQLDISGFFMAIDHHILYSLFKKMILKQNKSRQWEKDVLWLAKTIIFHKPTKNYVTKGNLTLFEFIPQRKSLFYSGPHNGLPIGNYSSQFFANLYLNELDQFIKRKLKCEYYVRYVDDFIILDKDKEKLKLWQKEISNFLQDNLNLRLSLRKTELQPIDKGIDFLGYFMKPDYVLIRKKVVSRLKDKLYGLNKNKEEIPELRKILATINSYYGHFKHAFSFNLRKHIYENHLGNLQKHFSPKTNYCSIKLLILIFVFFILILFPAKIFAAEYYATGTLVSKNLLDPTTHTAASIDYFGYLATTTATSTIKVQFSQDGATWYSSTNTEGAWDILEDGDHLATGDAINLSELSWSGPYFYYKLLFETSNTSTTPVMGEAKIYYTQGTAPTVVTETPSPIYERTAVANADITDDGGGVISERGFEYGLTATSTWSVNETGEFGQGAYSLNLTGLEPETTYYIRAYAINPEGTSYGDWLSFTTAGLSYYSTGTLVSKNILSGTSDVVIINNFFTSSTVPVGTSLWVQFSTGSETWYSAQGVEDTWTYVPDGQMKFVLYHLNWSGSNFYYKMKFETAEAGTSPVLDEIQLNYNLFHSPEIKGSIRIKGGTILR